MLTSRAKGDGGIERRGSNVFERLSTQQNYKKKSYQNSVKESNQTRKSLPKNGSSPLKKRGPPPNKRTQRNQINQDKSKNVSTELKSGSECHDSYHEKFLMENVPETTDKDIDESICNSNGVICNNKSIICNTPCYEREKTEIPLVENTNDNRNSLENIPKINSVQDRYSKILINGIQSPLSPSFTSDVRDSVINDTSNRRMVIPSMKPSSDSTLENYEANIDSYKQSNFSDAHNCNKDRKSYLSKPKYNQIVFDADKDLCDAESELDDSEFYKVKVQTRLVSYENSTLFIRNTSKQSLDSQSESDCSLTESTSSNSLHNSFGGQEFPSSKTTSNHLTVIKDDIPDEKTTFNNVKSKLGQLMIRGKGILNDMYNSSYVPDVKSSLHKFHGITNRSLKSLTFPKGNSSFLRGERGETFIGKNPDTDSGFSSLISVEQNCSFGNKSIFKPNPVIHVDNNSTGHEQNAPIDTDVSEVTPKPESVSPISENASLHQDVSTDEPGTDFSNFFHACWCEKGETPLKNAEYCACQQESEFPLEIKELLDADYARMWWTITGNFGNILPIDWSKTYTRQKYLPVLNLNETKKLEGNIDSVTPSPREDEDEEVAHDLDLHQLILAGTQQDSEPVKSAEEVIKEIDDMMQEGSSSEDEGIDASSSGSKDSLRSEQLPPPLYHDKIKDLSVNELNETLMGLEVIIRRYSETLISQLALRDELEYEKELKNTFISLILQVQNKRRNYNVEKKKIKKPMGPNGTDLKYLTTVIPYDVGHGPPDNETIQILIKILTAINDDSPTVPTLLTDYILRVLCPS